MLKLGDKVILGGNTYTVEEGVPGFFLNGYGIPNNFMFTELGYTNPKRWCIDHQVNLPHYTGAFPYMDIRHLSLTVNLLMQEFKARGMEARIVKH